MLARADVHFFGRTVQPLLYVLRAYSFDHGGNWQTSQSYVFRDGTVLGSELLTVFPVSLPLQGFTYSGRATAANMAALRTALNAAQAGKLTDCYYDPPDSPVSLQYRFTWFGRGDRRNTFVVTDSSTPPRCPPEVEGLLDAAFAVTASVAKAPQTVLSVPAP